MSIGYLADETRLSAFITFTDGSSSGALATYGFSVRKKIVTTAIVSGKDANSVSYSIEDQKITGHVYLPLNEKVEIARSVRPRLSLTTKQVRTAQRQMTTSMANPGNALPPRRRVVPPPK
ncbi:MAG: hypothetical protein AAGJ79_04670 [Verrucomicrobiota bacterium]